MGFYFQNFSEGGPISISMDKARQYVSDRPEMQQIFNLLEKSIIIDKEYVKAVRSVNEDSTDEEKQEADKLNDERNKNQDIIDDQIMGIVNKLANTIKEEKITPIPFSGDELYEVITSTPKVKEFIKQVNNKYSD